MTLVQCVEHQLKHSWSLDGSNISYAGETTEARSLLWPYPVAVAAPNWKPTV